MKISVFDNQGISDEALERAHGFLQFNSENFVAQARFLNLDPENDFKHSNLSRVDFTDCDLKGFDFTGCDLRGCTGRNVKWDSSTIFDGADSEGSVFHYSIQKAQYFSKHPEDLEMVRRLTNEMWSNSILGVERLLRDGARQEATLRIARAVFDDTPSTVVRSNVLAFMRLATDTADEHKSFIFNTFARFSNEPSMVLSGIRTLSGFYQDDLDVFNSLKSFLRAPDNEMRREAFKGLLRSKHFHRAVTPIREYVTNCGDSLMRRAFLGRLAALCGPSYVRAATDIDVSNYLDFALPLSDRKLEEMAYRSLQMRRLQRRLQDSSYNVTNAAPIVVKESEMLAMAKDFKKYLSVLTKRYRIPLNFSDTETVTFQPNAAIAPQ